ncbi:MAG: GNAT family N-acetyltransferase [Silicimonas sp.]|nr:GNAT family N-acetyltransferase [Silicimonas sp.]
MTDLLSIRRTTRDDLAEIDALLQRSYPALLKDHYPPSLMVTAIPLISKANPRLLTSSRYFAVCDADGVIDGAGGWSGRDPWQARSDATSAGQIRHVVTDHRRVRQGIGRELMRHILDDARASGVGRLDCLSTRMAVPFYAAAGFEAVQPVSITLAAAIAFPAILMRRAL